MLSESQERMLLVADKGREDEVIRVFEKWGLDAVIVGEVIPEPRLRILHHGQLVADIPNQSLTDDAPLYHRPVGEWKAPVSLNPPPEVLEKLTFFEETLSGATASATNYARRIAGAARLLEYLFQELDPRAVRLHGADQYGAGPGRRSRRHAHQGHQPRPGHGARWQ